MRLHGLKRVSARRREVINSHCGETQERLRILLVQWLRPYSLEPPTSSRLLISPVSPTGLSNHLRICWCLRSLPFPPLQIKAPTHQLLILRRTNTSLCQAIYETPPSLIIQMMVGAPLLDQALRLVWPEAASRQLSTVTMLLSIRFPLRPLLALKPLLSVSTRVERAAPPTHHVPGHRQSLRLTNGMYRGHLTLPARSSLA